MSATLHVFADGHAAKDRNVPFDVDSNHADRLGAVERSALRVAVHELETREVPAEVAINEAVAFAKRYASEDAARLVNGILGRIQREAA